MIIQLTNASDGFRNKPILINTEMVLSVYQSTRMHDDNTFEELTYVFCPPHGSWEVFETPEEIMKLIKGTNNGN
jgi:hypothetical protein